MRRCEFSPCAVHHPISLERFYGVALRHATPRTVLYRSHANRNSNSPTVAGGIGNGSLGLLSTPSARPVALNPEKYEKYKILTLRLRQSYSDKSLSLRSPKRPRPSIVLVIVHACTRSPFLERLGRYIQCTEKSFDAEFTQPGPGP